ncbi:hypothetical protein CKO38_11765 [Rhodospirillum rubrum]|uniref:tetratricopeptide repeat protein n=1 Tax=Rhodospirillum rubrum TaxID=1085 RepID=UPI0019049C22|nr:tetratricopeptide repeat protein [Rhodospirillum rubrum]MBK1665945.1 hypothetical protein [Rhodospirillum rubrum]MBK1677330.1 hypothetical protein [Rhodospirillum rubrum]
MDTSRLRPTSPLVRQAAACLDAGDADHADVLLDLHLSRHPEDSAGLSLLGLTRVALGRPLEAEPPLRRALALDPIDDPFHARAVCALVDVLKAQGRMAEVSEVLERAGDVAPMNAVFPRMLGAHYRALGQVGAAITAARRAVALEAGDGENWRGLAATLLDGAPAEALDALERAKTCGDDGADWWNIRGVALAALGDDAAAREAFKNAILRDGAAPMAWTNLGNLEIRAARSAEALERAVEDYGQAIQRAPDSFEAHNNLAQALRDLGRRDEALVHAERAASLRPHDAIVLNTQANILRGLKRVDEAVAILERALACDGRSAETHSNLGLALLAAQDRQGAEEHFRKAAALAPDCVDIIVNLAGFLIHINAGKEVLGILEAALARFPEDIALLATLGLYYFQENAYEDCAKAFETVLAKDPGHVGARASLGVVRWSQGRLVESLALAQSFREDFPEDVRTLFLLGCIHSDLLDNESALAAFDLALEKAGERVPAFHYSNCCFSFHYAEAMEKDELFARHQRWDALYGAGATELSDLAHGNDRDPERRLKIGYVSPDFRRHSVAYFFLPLVGAHDRAKVEVTCYSLSPSADQVTDIIREDCDRWRDIATLPAEKAAEMVREDGIDILVDLAGHTANNGLSIFALKPAPVQVTYLGYPNTTGLSAIDYRLTDGFADPLGVDEDPASETLWRLPRGFLLFDEVPGLPDPAPPPVLSRGTITFGSFNNMAKVNRGCVAVWKRILDAVPGSRLLLKARGFRDPATAKMLIDRLIDWGLDPEQVGYAPYAKNLMEHVAVYAEVDIALDTFPYNGTTTTFEALHMGVPVIGLRGHRHSGRVGASILGNLGLADRLLGEDVDDMVTKAVALAGDLEGLMRMRAGLRERLRASPLQDGPGFVADLEGAYRVLWRRWCAGPPTFHRQPKNGMWAVEEMEDAIEPVLG